MSLGPGMRHFCSVWLSVNSIVICLPSLPNAINMLLLPELPKTANDVKIGDGLKKF